MPERLQKKRADCNKAFACFHASIDPTEGSQQGQVSQILSDESRKQSPATPRHERPHVSRGQTHPATATSATKAIGQRPAQNGSEEILLATSDGDWNSSWPDFSGWTSHNECFRCWRYYAVRSDPPQQL